MLEVLIVIIILGIIAAIAVPRISSASDNAKANALMGSLREVRSRLEVYGAEHGGKYPDSRFVAQMTQYTDEQGNVSAAADPKFPFGPYLHEVPANPFSKSTQIRFLLFAGQTFGASALDRGWTYNVATGEFAADLADSRVTLDGTLLNKV